MITERLDLTPLTAEMLDLLINNLPKLERELDCVYKAEPIVGVFKDILSTQLTACKADSQNYRWHSFWLMIRRSDRIVVGSADFKAPPDGNGQVEIGYGLGAGFCGAGYMTETVSAMLDFAFSNGASRVVAETESDNAPSQNVLKHCGFTRYACAETMWWEKRKAE